MYVKFRGECGSLCVCLCVGLSCSVVFLSQNVIVTIYGTGAASTCSMCSVYWMHRQIHAMPPVVLSVRYAFTCWMQAANHIRWRVKCTKHKFDIRSEKHFTFIYGRGLPLVRDVPINEYKMQSIKTCQRIGPSLAQNDEKSCKLNLQTVTARAKSKEEEKKNNKFVLTFHELTRHRWYRPSMSTSSSSTIDRRVIRTTNWCRFCYLSNWWRYEGAKIWTKHAKHVMRCIADESKDRNRISGTKWSWKQIDAPTIKSNICMPKNEGVVRSA